MNTESLASRYDDNTNVKKIEKKTFWALSEQIHSQFTVVIRPLSTTVVSNHIRLEIPILLVSLDILKQFVEEESFKILDAHHSFFRVTHVLFIFQGNPIDYNNYTRRALENTTSSL